ncbi:hypothetical protein GCM10010156_66110 [Planobispora rosea]|uniref:Uncharacterized protein n=1 Tax=Planobispora rosea TaxID=35762 RepID=A0A8J3S753_PLARO|nr:hypothetical protein [Planobispora rosea]GGS98768.1 hypothetical protein GCM10010156_66110 [Planobispora rosea]GIH87975.1 hypothetical protein Pro02_63830 [Planobispora rosea]
MIVLGLTALPVPAQATGVDVVAAVTRLQSQGAAVKIYQRTSAGWPADPRMEALPMRECGRRADAPVVTGLATLGRGGVVAADMKRQVETSECALRFLKEDAANGDQRAADQVKIASAVHRMRTVGGRLYVSGPAYGSGTGWRTLGKAPGGAALYGDQIIDPFDVGTLKFLVKTATINKAGPPENDADGRRVSKTWQYRGTTTFAALFRASKPFRDMLGGRLDPKAGKISFMWGVHTDRRGVPVTVITYWWPRGDYPLAGATAATRYSWDVKASIAAPATIGPGRDPYSDDLVDAYRIPHR